MITTVITLLTMAVGGPSEDLRSLTLPEAGPMEVSRIVSDHDAETLAPLIVDLIADDPLFAPGQHAHELAIAVLARAQSSSGGVYIDDPIQINTLVQATVDPSSDVRLHALSSLGRFSEDNLDIAQTAVEGLLLDPDPFVVIGALKQGSEIGGLPDASVSLLIDLFRQPDQTNPQAWAASIADDSDNPYSQANPMLTLTFSIRSGAARLALLSVDDVSSALVLLDADAAANPQTLSAALLTEIAEGAVFDATDHDTRVQWLDVLEENLSSPDSREVAVCCSGQILASVGPEFPELTLRVAELLVAASLSHNDPDFTGLVIEILERDDLEDLLSSP